MKFDKEFDASGLACPLPIVKTKKSLSDMTPGQVLRVVATDAAGNADDGYWTYTASSLADAAYSFALTATDVAGKKASLVLKGLNAGDIPWGPMERFSLVVNPSAAHEQGLELPPTLLARADHVVKA